LSVGGIDKDMRTFIEWLDIRPIELLLHLLEAADFFNPQAYNAAFQKGLDALAQRITDADARKQVEAMRGFDFASYIERSLKRAGFRGDDLQEAFHSIVVRLLVTPGKLFVWNPQKSPNLDRRLRASIWNSIRNIAEKNRNYRKRMTTADPAVMAGQFPGRREHSDVIDQFRQLVSRRLGPLAAGILDQRLRGEESKTLVGQPELGSPSAYILKREIGEIKKLAHQFAMQSGDPAFLSKLERAMAGEAETVAKRKAATAGRNAGATA
jgi:hypothetical protein